MRKNDKKIFCDKSKLTSLLNLRNNGLSLTSLATLFSVDNMSIHHQLKKYQVEKPTEVYDIHRLLKNIIPQPLTMRHPQW